MNLAVKTVYLITNQKAKVKPFEDKVADFPVEKNSVAMLCLSESVNIGEEFTKSIAIYILKLRKYCVQTSHFKFFCVNHCLSTWS